MSPQPAQPSVDIKKLLPFFVLGGLIILGVVASAVVSQSKPSQTSSVLEGDQPENMLPSATEEVIPEMSVIVGQSADENSLTLSLDPGSNTFDQAISFSIDLMITPAINATEVQPAKFLTDKDWAYPIAIVEAKNAGTSVRVSGYSIKPTNLSDITEVATIPLNTPINLDEIEVSLIPKDSLAFDKKAVQYQLVLGQ